MSLSSSRRPDDSDLSVGGYHTERLDDVSIRLARVEGKMESLATREDVANAKLYLVVAGIGIIVAIVVGAISIVVKFWPT